MNNRQALAALATGALICLAGCGADDPPAPAAAKKSAPLSLSIATYDDKPVSGGMLVDHFAQAVHDLEPTLTIKPLYQAAADEEKTIGLLQAGDADLGLVATRAWDPSAWTPCARSTAPFLIDSTELLDQVVAGDQAGRR